MKKHTYLNFYCYYTDEQKIQFRFRTKSFSENLPGLKRSVFRKSHFNLVFYLSCIRSNDALFRRGRKF